MKKIVAFASVAALLVSAVPAFAGGYGFGGSNDIEVENSNHAFVSNDVTVTANTGDNWAYGGDATGGNANGGSVNGDIDTGDAYASGKVYNVVNSNLTDVKAPCSRNCKGGDIEVENKNSAFVSNGLSVGADTGTNDAFAGDATATGGCHHHCNSGTANGGSVNGEIQTGDAGSSGKVVNVVNTNLTRVSRGSSYHR